MSSNFNISTRSFTDRDLPELLHLFADGMRSYEAFPYRLYWEWKHYQNPFGPSPVLLAVCDNQIVGIRAFQRWLFNYQDKSIPAFRAVDTVTAPLFQGRGIFKTLTLELIQILSKDESSSFIFNTPNKVSRPGYLKMGWEQLGKARVFLRVVPFAGWLKRKEWDRLQQNLLDYPFDDARPSNASAYIHVPKSSGYLKWRYQQYPFPDYGLFVSEYRQEPYYFFIKIRHHQFVRELRICEVWSKVDRDWSFIALTATRLARRLGCGTVSLLPEPGHSVALFRHGFIPVQPFANIITIRDLNMGDSFEPFRHLKNWAFAMGDLELF